MWNSGSWNCPKLSVSRCFKRLRYMFYPCHAELLRTELSHVCRQVQASLDQGPDQPKAAKVTSSSMMQEG